MGNFEEKRKRFKSQIAELHRLAEEAEGCAKLLRQQAETHEELLTKEDLTEEQLDKLLADKPKQSFGASGPFIVTEGLM